MHRGRHRRRRADRPAARGRLIFPAPSLFYLIAALVAGIVYNRSTSKTELVLGATQWIADGFFLMALATVLAIVIITARWYLGRRGGRGQPAPDRPGPAAGTSRRAQRARDEYRDEYETTGDRNARGTPGAAPPLRPSRPQPGPRPQGSAGPDQRNGPYPGQFSGGPNYGSYPERRDGDRRPGPAYDQRPGSGPYNFSSGA